jgi:DNA-binding NarL/FixJ family response regulator
VDGRKLHLVVDDQTVVRDGVFAALQAGARGYLTKDAGADQIARAIDAVRGGDAHLAGPPG